MGHNRSGDRRRARLKRAKREMERLAIKSGPAPIQKPVQPAKPKEPEKKPAAPKMEKPAPQPKPAKEKKPKKA